MGVGDDFFVFYINRQRYRIFYFPEKVVFCAFMRNIEWMNEKTFFSLFFPAQKSNEWMTFELFRGKEKKKQKNTEKNGKKKKHKQLLLKNIGTSSKSEWMTDELFRGN